MRACAPYVGGQRCQDVGIYFSTASKFDPDEKGTDLSGGTASATNQEPSGRMPHVDGVFQAAAALIRQHVPYGILTRRNLDSLDRFRVLVLPDVLMMDDEEVEALRAYVAAGGALYASQHTSLQKTDGSRPGDFMLADVFGVSSRGVTEARFAYVAPVQGQEDLFDGYSAKYPLGIAGRQTRLRAVAGAEVLATLALPYSGPDDWQDFTSIHSDPPAPPTDEPAVVRHAYGAGQVIYSAAPLEAVDSFERVFVNLLRSLCPRFSFGAEAPPVVEVMAFWQPDHDRHLVSALNFQEQQPNVPVRNARVRVDAAGRQVRAVRLLPDETELPFALQDGYVEFEIPEIEVLRMAAVEYV